LGLPPAQAATRYIGPSGNNGANGQTTGTPWKTFSFAVGQLAPGDTLFLLDGTYGSAAGTGLPFIDCSSNAANGTAALPITFKALNERKALLQGTGPNTFEIWHCAYWTIEGVFARNIDSTSLSGGGEGTLFALQQSDHLTLRRNLGYNANAYGNSHGIALYNTNNTLVEENEIYYSTRHGILQGWDQNSNNPTGNIIRRNYVNGRGKDTAPGGFTCTGSCENTTMDEGISCYPCMNTIVENNIVEDAYTGISIQGEKDPFNNKFLGNILLSHAGNGGYGSLGFSARDEGGFVGTARQMPTDILVENTVIIDGTYAGCGACKRLTWKNLTLINTTEGFIMFPTGQGDGHNSVTGQNLYITNTSSGHAAFAISGEESQSFDYVRAFSNAGGTGFDGSFTHTSTNDPSMGTCKVWIPDGSNLKGAGLAGADIGANVLYRYINGTLTATPLWDTTTGKFPCGAQVAGINDVAGASCFDVHTRLNVNTGGCAFPTDFAPGGGGTVPLVYVSPTGDDTRTCATAQVLTTPKKTLNSGLACLAPGGTLYLRGGTYVEAVDTQTRSIPGGTSWSAPTTIAAYQNEVVIIQNPALTGLTTAGSVFWLRDPSTHYIVLDKLRLAGALVANSNGIKISDGAHHIRFQNGQVADTTLSGIYIGDATDIEILTTIVSNSTGGLGNIGIAGTTDTLTVQGNTILTSARPGIFMEVTPGVKTNTALVANTIHDLAGAGIVGIGVTGTGLAANNLIYTVPTGFQVQTGASGFKVYNNTLTAASGTGLQIDSGATGTLVTNALLFGNATALVNNGTGTIQTTNFTADPLFVDGAGHNYDLQPTSLAHNVGTTLTEVPLDILGRARGGSPYDIGAYESAASVVVAAPAAPTNLRITGTTVGAIDTVALAWDYTPTDLFSGTYNLYRQAACTGALVRMNTSVIRPLTLVYTDGTVPPGATYCWIVRAQNAQGVESANSNSVTVVAAAYVPGTLTLAAALTGGPTTYTVHLTWTFANGTPPTVGFNVYRRDNCGVSGRTKVNGSLVSVAAVSFDDAAVQNGKSHCWQVVGQAADTSEVLFSGLVSLPVPALPEPTGLHGAGGGQTVFGGRR
jgi:hypothetical protein